MRPQGSYTTCSPEGVTSGTPCVWRNWTTAPGVGRATGKTSWAMPTTGAERQGSVSVRYGDENVIGMEVCMMGGEGT